MDHLKVQQPPPDHREAGKNLLLKTNGSRHCFVDCSWQQIYLLTLGVRLSRRVTLPGRCTGELSATSIPFFSGSVLKGLYLKNTKKRFKRKCFGCCLKLFGKISMGVAKNTRHCCGWRASGRAGCPRGPSLNLRCASDTHALSIVFSLLTVYNKR